MSSSGGLAIRADGLSKSYRVRAMQTRANYRTLQEEIMGLPKRLRRALRGGTETERFWALDNISLEVSQGEVLGIIGRNGAGKSTLLKLFSRITEPTRGYAELYGRVGTLLEIGTGFHPELTGRENVYLSGAILGMRRREIEHRFDEIVAFAEVERFIDTPVKHYSSGMYMRLAFSVAAHLEPEILVVDEVLAVGDAEFQKRCLGKMGEVADTGRTVLFVSHNMNAIAQLCDSALVLESGRVARWTTDVRTAIEYYLSGGGASSPPSEWVRVADKHTNPWFSPSRFFLGDAQGRPLATPISNDTEVWFVVEGTVVESDPGLCIGYAIYSEDGTLLYWTYHTDLEEKEWPALNPGQHTLAGQVPRRLLNEGRYRIDLIGSLHFRAWLFEPGVSSPSVHLAIQGGLSDSPLWMVRRPGLLAPNLRWRLLQ